MHKKFDLTIFQKLIVTFTAIVVIPLAGLMFVSQKLTTDQMVAQLSIETISAIELVANNVDSVFQKMYSLALYVNDDDNIKELLLEDYADSNGANSDSQSFRKLTRINRFNSLLSNLTFNLMIPHSYVSIIGVSGSSYTSWARNLDLPQSYSKHPMDEGGAIWVELEENYVRSESSEYPYVISFGKNIIRASDKTVYGTIIISLSERAVADLLSSGQNQESRAIVDRHGTIISATRPEWVGQQLHNI